MSHALWQRVFGANPTVIGRTVRIEGVPGNVVVGVMPAGFSFPPGAELWVPPSASRAAGDARAVRSYGALGRLKPNASVAGARADLQSIAAVLAREHPATNAGWTVAVLPLHDSVVGGHRLGLMTLFAAVASVMLVGCANMSNLLLARGVRAGTSWRSARHSVRAVDASPACFSRRLPFSLCWAAPPAGRSPACSCPCSFGLPARTYPGWRRRD